MGPIVLAAVVGATLLLSAIGAILGIACASARMPLWRTVAYFAALLFVGYLVVQEPGIVFFFAFFVGPGVLLGHTWMRQRIGAPRIQVLDRRWLSVDAIIAVALTAGAILREPPKPPDVVLAEAQNNPCSVMEITRWQVHGRENERTLRLAVRAKSETDASWFGAAFNNESGNPVGRTLERVRGPGDVVRLGVGQETSFEIPLLWGGYDDNRIVQAVITLCSGLPYESCSQFIYGRPGLPNPPSYRYICEMPPPPLPADFESYNRPH